ncbi:MAG: hypothetical protein WCW17_00295 [Patescibacteria group bacterium]|jgi:hypothetical protein
MANTKGKVTFRANKTITKPVKVEFTNRRGERVSFTTHEKVIKPVKVEFYVRRKK